jgi:hypothetical protein
MNGFTECPLPKSINCQLAHGCCVGSDDLLKLGWVVIWMCRSAMCGSVDISLLIDAKFVLLQSENMDYGLLQFFMSACLFVLKGSTLLFLTVEIVVCG